jgi:integrase
MATYRRLPSGLWQVQIFRKGIRRSATFEQKGAAVAWAGRTEAEIMAGSRGEPPNLPLKSLLDRYNREVSVRKKGARWESVRLEALGRDRIALVKLRQFGPAHVSDWRERRLQAVSGASVRREWNLLSHVCTYAVREWGWLKANPFKGLSRPSDARPRNRIATQAELDRLTAEASPQLRRVIEFAVETGMRASEIASRPTVKGRVAHLLDSKNGAAREVPLSAAAIKAWGDGITMSAGSISALFALLCGETKVEGLTFHDLRATAATRLAKKLNPYQLAKMLGHKNLKVAMVYFRESTEDIADKL